MLCMVYCFGFPLPNLGISLGGRQKTFQKQNKDGRHVFVNHVLDLDPVGFVVATGGKGG